MIPIQPLHARILQKTTSETWRIVATRPHGTTCPGMISEEEDEAAKARRWTCSKCSARGVKAI